MPQMDNFENIIKNVPLLLYRNAFLAIVAVLEARDDHTAHHSERVAFMINNFCSIMQLPPLHAKMIETTAVVHDIGKVGISDATLKKCGKLAEAEWSEIRKHPVIGADILSKAGKLENVAEGVLYHHERWNGTGYPEGLIGEDIPLNARMIAICDSIDAMMSKRVYRDAMSEDYCKCELARNKEIMYDPTLVDTCLDNWNAIVGNLFTC